MVNGNMCCGVSGAALLVRVGRDDYPRLLAQPFVRPLEFGGRRPAGFVLVDPPGCDRTTRSRHGFSGVQISSRHCQLRVQQHGRERESQPRGGRSSEPRNNLMQTNFDRRSCLRLLVDWGPEGFKGAIIAAGKAVACCLVVPRGQIAGPHPGQTLIVHRACGTRRPPVRQKLTCRGVTHPRMRQVRRQLARRGSDW